MRRQRKSIIVGAGVLAALLILVAWLRMPEEKAQDVRKEETEKQESLVNCMEEIQSIRVEKSGERMEFLREDGRLIVQGIPEEKRDERKAAAAVAQLCESLITEHLGKQEELEQFGLGKEAAKFAIRDASEQVQEFEVGNWLNGSTDERYMLIDRGVCVVRNFPPELLQGKKAFYCLELISISGKENEGEWEEPKLDYLELTGKNFEEPVIIVQSDETQSGYFMKEPVYSEAMFAPTDMRTGSISILSYLRQVSAEAAAVLQADAETVRKYEMDEPQACIRYGFDGEEHNLRVGKRREDGTRYLMVDDDQTIYLIREEKVSAWAEADVMDFRTSYIWLVDVGLLERLTVSAGEKEFEYCLDWKQGEEGQKELTVSCGGRNIDIEKVWLPFYQKLLGMTVMSVIRPSSWEEEPDFCVTYGYAETCGKDDVTVSFYKSAEDGCYAAFLNGRFAGTLRINTVEELMELTDRVNADEENN